MFIFNVPTLFFLCVLQWIQFQRTQRKAAFFRCDGDFSVGVGSVWVTEVVTQTPHTARSRPAGYQSIRDHVAVIQTVNNYGEIQVYFNIIEQ